MGDFINSIREGFSDFTFADITVGRILITMLLAFIIGLYIFVIYKKTFAGVMYSRNTGVSLVMMCLISAAIILPITSNLTLSLGMVGALSIVRFRTAIKEPTDTVYMFWAISAGITLGAKFYLPAILISFIIGLLILLLSAVKLKSTMPYILVLHYSDTAKSSVNEVLKRVPDGKVKSKTITQSGIELTIELRLKNNDTQIIDRFTGVPGVYNATLVSYNGDIVG